MVAILGIFTRLMADDYCYGSSLRAFGLVMTLETYYQTWFGRLTQIIGASVGSAIGVPFAATFPAILLILWLIAAWFAAREIALLLRWRIPAAIPVLIVATTLAGTPQLLHSLYWISGVFPYTVPLVLITALAGLIARAARRGRASVPEISAAALLAFFAVTSSEPAALLVIGLLGLAGVAWLVQTQFPRFLRNDVTKPPSQPSPEFGGRRKHTVSTAPQTPTGAQTRFRLRPSPKGWRLLLFSLAAALIAFVILLRAPGNTLRQDLFAGTHAPIPLFTQSFVYASAFVAVSITQFSPAAAFSAFLLPLLIVRPADPLLRRQRRAGMILTAVITFGLILAMMLPNIYATSEPPPARVWIIPQFVFMIGLAIMGTLAAPRRPQRWLIIAAILALVWLIGGETLDSARLIAPYSEAAAAWDAADLTLRAAEADAEVILPPPALDLAATTALEVLSDDPNAWLNQCAARYYDVRIIRVMRD